MSDSAPGRFELLGRLGAGGMGEVFLARRVADDVLVALKRVRADLRAQESFAEHFEREAQVSQLLDHPNIVALEEWGADDEGPYLALEYVEGCTAAALLKQFAARNENMPLSIAYGLCIQAGHALCYAHGLLSVGDGRGVLHRDVSLDNVLVATDGSVKLADFGIAKMMGTTRLTTTGTAKGKYGYMAPELFEGQDATVATDIFAFGVSCYELLCGVRPFAGRSEAEILRAVLHAEPPPPSILRPQVPASVSDVILQCLRKPAAERPATLGEVVTLLEEGAGQPVSELQGAIARALEETGPTALAPVVAPLPKKNTVRVPRRTRPQTVRGVTRRARSLALLSVAAALLVSGGLFLYLWTRAPRSASPQAASADSDLHKPPPSATATAPTLPGPFSDPLPSPPPALDTSGRPKHAPGASVTPRPASSKPVSTRTALWIKVAPWGQVFVDGEPWGATPLEARPIEPGAHSVIVVNPELRKERKLTVRVRKGEQKQLRLDLQNE